MNKACTTNSQTDKQDNGGPSPLDSNKSLKMKIKRKSPPSSSSNMGLKGDSSKPEAPKPGMFGSGGSGNSSSTNNTSGSSTSAAADRHDSNSNSSSSISSVTSNSTSSTGKVTQPHPFEKLRQAILEQEKSKKLQHKGAAASDKDKSRDLGQGHGSNTGNVFSRGSLASSSDVTSHGQKHFKADPYEFNAKNEDRLAAGLPSAKKIKTEKERVEMRDAMTDTSHIAIMTDPDCLGPCEPGTSVVLEGIVWQETENGLLVVNVTWRGKTYVGTLLDATKHEWAPPTFRSDSPQDPDARAPRTRGKKGRTTMNSMGVRGTRNTRNSSSSNHGSNPPPSPAKSNSAASCLSLGEKRKQEILSDIAIASPAKKLKIEDDTPRPPNVIEDTWYVCFHADCNHRYRYVSALKFHQNHAHKDLLLTSEQSSEHNKTHVRFDSSPQQNSAAQTEEKHKRNKKKKSKKSKTDAPMEIDQTTVNSVNSDQTNAIIQQAESTVTGLPTKSSPDSKLATSKQPFMQLATGSSVQSSAAKTRTITAPMVAVPLASAAQIQNDNLLSKEEKKREKKKRKKEKKEKKFLLEQQQQVHNDSGQRLAHAPATGSQQNSSLQPLATNSHANVNRNVDSKDVTMGLHGSHVVAHAQQRQLTSSERNKMDDACKQVSVNTNSTSAPRDTNVHSPAYSDISDEGNDNVPVLENQVELAKKQTQNEPTAEPKDCHIEPVIKSPGQEPPNLTAVITHTGHSKPAPLPSAVQSQMYPGGKDPSLLHVNNSGVRNAPPSSSANCELNRPREAFSARESTKLSANEMQQKRPTTTVQPPHPVFPNFPAGYHLNHQPVNPKTGPQNTHTNQERISQQKLKDDGMKGCSILPPNVLPSPKGPTQKASLLQQQRPDNRQGDMARRTVDSNMNMQSKVPLSVPNGPPMPHVNKANLSPVTDTNKQVPNAGNSDGAKRNMSEHKRLADAMSISERQVENEKILKENIELKTQMCDTDKDTSPAMYEQRGYAAYFQQQQQQQHHQQRMTAQQQQQYLRGRLMEQASKPKPPGSSPDSTPDARPCSSHAAATPSSQPHPSVASLPRRDASPMPSPKTKAELKQGGERKDGGAKVESRIASEQRRSDSVDKTPETMRASAMKSPSPSMSSPVPPPGTVPPGHYPYPYPYAMAPYGMSPYMFPPGAHAYMPYPDGKALEMLHQQAALYNRDQNKAQDLRKLPDRKSPNLDSERPGSRSSHSETRESPAPMVRSPHITHAMAGHPGANLPQWYLHHNGPLPMMQHSPQPSSKH